MFCSKVTEIELTVRQLEAKVSQIQFQDKEKNILIVIFCWIMLTLRLMLIMMLKLMLIVTMINYCSLRNLSSVRGNFRRRDWLWRRKSLSRRTRSALTGDHLHNDWKTKTKTKTITKTKKKTKTALEKEITVKKNSISIDR